MLYLGISSTLSLLVTGGWLIATGLDIEGIWGALVTTAGFSVLMAVVPVARATVNAALPAKPAKEDGEA